MLTSHFSFIYYITRSAPLQICQTKSAAISRSALDYAIQYARFLTSSTTAAAQLQGLGQLFAFHVHGAYQRVFVPDAEQVLIAVYIRTRHGCQVFDFDGPSPPFQFSALPSVYG